MSNYAFNTISSFVRLLRVPPSSTALQRNRNIASNYFCMEVRHKMYSTIAFT